MGSSETVVGVVWIVGLFSQEGVALNGEPVCGSQRYRSVGSVYNIRHGKLFEDTGC